ncbi:MAG: serine/threonine protein kinase [Pseudanabaenaceae cyanobacterium]
MDELLREKGYQIVEELGRGATGTTYHCRMLATDRAIALKVISLRQVRDWKVIELFTREAKVLSNLNHPNIPKYVDHFTIETAEDIYFCLGQELAPGKSLDKLYAEGWRPQERELKKIAQQVMTALVYLHSLNPPVIHRDIKPQNIIYQPDTQKAFLIDFGTVQDVYRNTFSHGLTFVGTMGFIAPEQYTGQVSFASDLYSLAATIVYLITGMNPADIPQKRMVIDWRRLATVAISREFGNWLDSLLEPIPEKRAFNSQAVLDSLLQKGKSTLGLKSQVPNLENVKIEITRNRESFVVVGKKIKRKNYFVPPTGIFTIAINIITVTLIVILLRSGLPFSNLFGLPLILIVLIWFALSALANIIYFGKTSSKELWLFELSLDREKLNFTGRGIRCSLDSPEISGVHVAASYDIWRVEVYYGVTTEVLFDEKLGIPLQLADWLATEINHFLELDED